MSIRRRLATRAAGFIRDWWLPRHLAGASSTSEAAKSTYSRTLRPRLEQADKVGTSICPYCAVGCAQLLYARNGRVVHVAGDPRSPINQGTLCPKGAATFGLLTSPLRLTRVLYRAPTPITGSSARSPGRWTGSPISPSARATRPSCRSCPTARP